jgi:outer membrane murein-binding lipoprotein Lpp
VRMATAETDKTKKQRDVIARLADRGEEALQRLGDIPGGSRAVKAFNDLKTRVDELSKKVRGIDELEARVAKLEKDVATLKRAAKAPAPKKPSAARKPAA